MSKLSIQRFNFYLQKRFFSANPLVKPQETTCFTVQYLMNSCGLPLKSAISVSEKVQLLQKNKPQYDSIVTFIKSNDFNDTQVAKFVEKQPLVLFSRVSSNLEPKISFLTENGVSSSIIAKLFALFPNLLFRSLDAQVKPVMELLKDYIGCEEKIQVAIVRGSWIFNCNVENTLRPNVEFLVQQGVSKSRIGNLLVAQPRCLYWTRVEKMVDAVNKVKSVGVKPTEPVFIYALRAVLNLSELSWKRKVGVFESMGWSYDDVISMFVRNPICLTFSEKKLRAAMDFLVNTVNIDPKVVIGYPKVLQYSLEKRMVPRYAVWKILIERNLIQKTQFIWLLNRSDKIFIDAYITRFSDDIPHLRGIYDQSKKLGRMAA